MGWVGGQQVPRKLFFLPLVCLIKSYVTKSRWETDEDISKNTQWVLPIIQEKTNNDDGDLIKDKHLPGKEKETCRAAKPIIRRCVHTTWFTEHRL